MKLAMCPQCGQEIHEHTTYCGNCGFQLKQLEREKQMKLEKCPKCGHEMQENITFCGHCGFQLKQSVTSTQNTNIVTTTVKQPIADVETRKIASSPQNILANVAVSTASVGRLKTNRSLLKFLLLGPITLGIYPLVVMSAVSNDINIIASRYDGKKTMHYCLLFFLVGGLTLGIAYIVWYHKLSARIGNELRRRKIPYSFGAGSYWGWSVLGALIIVGPFIYLRKLFKAMNLLAKNYNING